MLKRHHTPQNSYQHCPNEYDDHIYSEEEKRKEKEYQENYDGITHCTRGDLRED
jgi:hypothetical protein